VSASPHAWALLRAARRRLWLDALLVAAPGCAAAAALGWRLLDLPSLLLGGAIAAGLALTWAWRRAAGLSARRFAARLDALAPPLEDSAALLFAAPETLSGLAALQRRRIEARLAQGLQIDPRPPWSRAALLASCAAGLLILAVAVFSPAWPSASSPVEGAHPELAKAATPVPRLQTLRLRVEPPTYTGLAAFSLDHSAANPPPGAVPAGALVTWTAEFATPPAAARLIFADGAHLALTRKNGRWTAQRRLDASKLYRIEATGAAATAWRRLEAVADAAPVVRLVEPSERLSLAEPGQTRWRVVFEATDDYGLAATATVRVTTAGGEGEQIAVARRESALTGSGEARRKRWTVTLDLAREGLEPGGDLIVQLLVRDNRRPAPQTAEGPSAILRRPIEETLADGVEGLAVRVLPALFRSQRQIILDAEALVREQPRLAPATFAARSQALGADQAALRLRYGQFLGEEAEGATLPTADSPPLPTSDAPPPPTADAPAPAPPRHYAGDGHDHGPDEALDAGPPDPARDVARQFGHVHDEGDAATLFDPGTRTLLAKALDAMWGSERELRQARPQAALPYARAALEALKQAQQADRIYLRKTGPRLPPLDLARRLGGKRAGISPVLPAAPETSAPPEALAQAWRSLQTEEDPAAALMALERWAVSEPDAALALLPAIDALRRDPACADCRKTLAAALWPILDTAPGARRRAGADPAGRRYLEAIP